MNLNDSLKNYLSTISPSKFKSYMGESGGYISFQNSGQGGSVKAFTLSLESILSGLSDIETNISIFKVHERYIEREWRDLGGKYFKEITLNSIVTVQTKPTFTTFSKLISWANDLPSYDDNVMHINKDYLAVTQKKIRQLIDDYKPKEGNALLISKSNNLTLLPKPFILLAGISGTGKTRFVREQASRFDPDLANYCLVSVRPDWHEPSDLLGYISRIGSKGARYISTDFLRFMVAAWKHIEDQIKQGEQIIPYWLCLDEMNLAPVEQYFSDYLSIIETRCWKEGEYLCDAIFSSGIFKDLDSDGLKALRADLGLDKAQYDHLWDGFVEKGISIPYNLIVAGTVNMDETTHGFSRKVIDRAFTLDFGEFFPNDYAEFFSPSTQPVTLSYPTISQVTLGDLSITLADSDGQKSIDFLEKINQKLRQTPFELAYRALNELLIAVVNYQPSEELALQSVWDDFLMSKVLPRIEGDTEKLKDDGESSLLKELETLLSGLLGEIWDKETRIDLLRENTSGDALMVACRSQKKLKWMQERLDSNGFTSFWP